jgi:hypothetical protein
VIFPRLKLILKSLIDRQNEELNLVPQWNQTDVPGQDWSIGLAKERGCEMKMSGLSEVQIKFCNQLEEIWIADE